MIKLELSLLLRTYIVLISGHMLKEEMVGQHCVCKFGMCNILFAAVPEIDQLETGSSPAPGRHQGCHNPRLWSRRLCNLSTLSTVCVSRTAEHCRMTHVNIANADVLIPRCDLLRVLTAVFCRYCRWTVAALLQCLHQPILCCGSGLASDQTVGRD